MRGTIAGATPGMLKIRRTTIPAMTEYRAEKKARLQA
jgi:hypothetical protein